MQGYPGQLTHIRSRDRQVHREVVEYQRHERQHDGQHIRQRPHARRQPERPLGRGHDLAQRPRAAPVEHDGGREGEADLLEDQSRADQGVEGRRRAQVDAAEHEDAGAVGQEGPHGDAPAGVDAGQVGGEDNGVVAGEAPRQAGGGLQGADDGEEAGQDEGDEEEARNAAGGGRLVPDLECGESVYPKSRY